MVDACGPSATGLLGMRQERMEKILKSVLPHALRFMFNVLPLEPEVEDF